MLSALLSIQLYAKMAQVVLYDNPSRFGTGTCWSPNVWKSEMHSVAVVFSLDTNVISLARLLLNFKGIDYRTEWLHGPDIEPTLASLYVRPTAEQTSTPKH
jgi:hypothetical protein